MEIDIATGLIAFLSIAALSLPFLLDRRMRRKRNDLLVRTVQAMAHAHQGRISQHGICGDAILGLDHYRAILYFINRREGMASEARIDLRQVRACEAAIFARGTKGSAEPPRTERVELSLLPRDGSKGATRLLLFRDGLGQLANGEAQFAEDWARVISARIDQMIGGSEDQKIR